MQIRNVCIVKLGSVARVCLVMMLCVLVGKTCWAQQELQKVAESNVGSTKMESLALDEGVTATLVTDASGNVVDIKLSIDDGEGVLNNVVLSDANRKELLAVQGLGLVDRKIKFTSLELDYGAAANIITDEQGNLVAANATLFDGVNLISRSSSDDRPVLSMKNLHLISVGDSMVAICRSQAEQPWGMCGQIDYKIQRNTVPVTNAAAPLAPASDCSIAISILDCNTIVVGVACKAKAQVFILCRASCSGANSRFQVCMTINLV